MPELEAHLIGDETAFLGLADEWNGLADATNPDNVFLRHEWFVSAWQWLRSRSVLHIVCIRRNEALVGIVPMVRSSGVHSRLRCATFEFLSIPDTQSCEILAAPADLEAVAVAALGYLLTAAPGLDVVEFSKVPTESSTWKALMAARDTGPIPGRVTDVAPNPAISLSDTWTAYYGRRSRRLKKGNNYIVNVAKKAGKSLSLLRFPEDFPSPVDATAILASLVELSSSSWKRSTGLTLNNPGPQAFIRELTDRAIQNGWLRVWLVKVGDDVAAMEYQLVYKGVVSALRADHDPRFDKFSPGTYLNWKMLECSFGLGLDRYFFGPGDNDYKHRWSESEEQLGTLMFYGRTLKGQSIRILDTCIRPILERARRTAP